MQVVFISEQPKIIIEPDGVRLIGRSGDEPYERRFTRAFWRQFLETESFRLAEYERKEGNRVVPFKAAAGRERGH